MIFASCSGDLRFVMVKSLLDGMCSGGNHFPFTSVSPSLKTRSDSANTVTEKQLPPECLLLDLLCFLWYFL